MGDVVFVKRHRWYMTHAVSVPDLETTVETRALDTGWRQVFCSAEAQRTINTEHLA
jgi:hypothetical protein